MQPGAILYSAVVATYGSLAINIAVLIINEASFHGQWGNNAPAGSKGQKLEVCV